MIVKKQKNNPYPIRLGGELKASLQMEAAALEHSLHWLVIKILKEHLSKKKAG